MSMVHLYCSQLNDRSSLMLFTTHAPSSCIDWMRLRCIYEQLPNLLSDAVQVPARLLLQISVRGMPAGPPVQGTGPAGSSADPRPAAAPLPPAPEGAPSAIAMCHLHTAAAGSEAAGGRLEEAGQCHPTGKPLPCHAGIQAAQEEQEGEETQEKCTMEWCIMVFLQFHLPFHHHPPAEAWRCRHQPLLRTTLPALSTANVHVNPPAAIQGKLHGPNCTTSSRWISTQHEVHVPTGPQHRR